MKLSVGLMALRAEAWAQEDRGCYQGLKRKTR
jgi:hypothetical protein